VSFPGNFFPVDKEKTRSLVNLAATLRQAIALKCKITIYYKIIYLSMSESAHTERICSVKKIKVKGNYLKLCKLSMGMIIAKKKSTDFLK
jgi:hypothetical protein